MSRNRNRTVLVLIFALFFIPLVAAIVMQSKWVSYEPEQTVNLGTLVEPPVLMDEAALRADGNSAEQDLRRRWVLIHPLLDGCDASCREVVTLLRQIHISTGRHQDEVAVLLLSAGEVDVALNRELKAIYDRFVIAADPEGTAVAALTAANGGQSPPPGMSYIADPDGNLMLRYAPGYAPADLNKDLRKLLKWSGR